MSRLILIVFLLNVFVANSQSIDKKVLHINRATEPPKIDGIINENIWQKAEVATGFVQFRPEMGPTLPENERTEVRMTYDDEAIYVAAYLYDDPEKMLTQLTSRDNFGQTDFFAIILNPNNDSQNDTEFFIEHPCHSGM